MYPVSLDGWFLQVPIVLQVVFIVAESGYIITIIGTIIRIDTKKQAVIVIFKRVVCRVPAGPGSRKER
jgi:hypothetical protein